MTRVQICCSIHDLILDNLLAWDLAFHRTTNLVPELHTLSYNLAYSVVNVLFVWYLFIMSNKLPFLRWYNRIKDN